MRPRRLTKPIAIGAAALALGGGGYGIVSATTSSGSGTATAATAVSATSGHTLPGKAGSNARSAPAAGGSIGKVSSVSTSGFAVSTPTGGKVTIKETSSTKYEKGATVASNSAVTRGATVLVLGTDDNTTITATQVIVGPPKPNSTTASQVVAFNRTAGKSKTVGQIPSSYTQGTGTILGGTTANKATEAALLTYPGGVVDRVVKLSNGDYEVHSIGVNWPHHIFVNSQFKVIGAND